MKKLAKSATTVTHGGGFHTEAAAIAVATLSEMALERNGNRRAQLAAAISNSIKGLDLAAKKSCDLAELCESQAKILRRVEALGVTHLTMTDEDVVTFGEAEEEAL